MEYLLLISASVIIAYATVSAVVPKTLLTAPLCFVVTGVLLTSVLGGAEETAIRELIGYVAEVTLVILLFTDASRIDLRSLMRGLGLPFRLLGVGLPLTIILGTVAAKLVFPAFSLWEAALLSAILAPTDAALGQAVVSSRHVPLRIRQALNVESGLNDGIAVPFVMLFASLAAVSPESSSVAHWLTFWIKQVTFGPLAGVSVGALGGILIETAARRGWVSESFMKLSGVALAVLAWTSAVAVGGNGFIAAFTAGLAIGCMTRNVKPAIQQFGETEGQLLSLVAFLLFGAILVVPALRDANGSDWFYAVLSLTVVRMLPVAVCLLGSRVRVSTVGFIGWFGPRGLASLIFALLVTGEHQFSHGEQILNVALLTASLSVLVHGISAVPGAAWYGRLINAESCHEGCEHESVVEYPLRFRETSQQPVVCKPNVKP